MRCFVSAPPEVIERAGDNVTIDNTLVSPSDEDTVISRSGSDVSMSCTAVGSPLPTISWTHEGTVVSSSESVSIVSSQTGSEATSRLTLSGVDVSDAGSYSCVSSNPVGSDSSSVDIEVARKRFCLLPSLLLYKRVLILATNSPVIDRRPDEEPSVSAQSVTTTIGRSDVYVGDGQNLRVKCTATGNPTPTVTWEKGGNEIGSTGRVRVEAEGTLNVDDFEGRDVGAYTCAATNSQGIDRQSISVSRAGKVESSWQR